jgi:protein TonB
VAAFHALLGYIFIAGLGFDVVREVREELKMFDVAREVPPPPAEPPPPTGEMTEKKKTPDPEGAASPANLRNTPSPIVAPPPKVRLEVPPPVIAAPVAAEGTAPAAGAAEVPGPGTGKGGQGTGTGSGEHGNGNGGGGGGGVAVGPRYLSGIIRSSDYPRPRTETGPERVVHFRVVVGTDGRLSRCRVTRSSGYPDLDKVTCRLYERRFRFSPARDVWGRAVPQVLDADHAWWGIGERGGPRGQE